MTSKQISLRTLKLTVLLITLIFSQVAFSQFGNLEDIIPSINGRTYFEDIDNDGDLDQIISGDGKMSMYENLGGGTLGPNRTIIQNHTYSLNYYHFNELSPFFDFDNDGDLDTYSYWGLVGLKNIYLIENMGNAVFQEPQLIATLNIDKPVFVDVDLDGDMDMVGRQNTWDDIVVSYNNAGVFSLPQAINTTALFASPESVLDFDANGFPDVLISRQDSLFVFYNTNGSFTGENFVLELPAGSNEIIYSDVDNDGLIDISSIGTGSAIQLHRNLGNNTFAFTNYAQSSAGGNLSSIDIDNDNDLDYYFTYSNGFGFRENTGNGTFSNPSVQLVLQSNYQFGIPYFMDLTGDNNPEIFYLRKNDWDVNEVERTYLVNTGNLNFTAPFVYDSIYALGANELIVADFNQNGQKEIIVSSDDQYTTQTTLFSLNNPNGLTQNELFSSHNLLSAEHLDFTSDGLEDVFGWVQGTEGIFYEQIPGLNFQPIDTIVAPNLLTVKQSRFYDLNADGLLDLVILGNLKVGYYLNLGNWNFGPFVQLNSSSGHFISFDIGDIDGDNIPDIVCARNEFTTTGEFRWYSNNGNGTFSSANIESNNEPYSKVILGDIDGDGDNDLISTEDGALRYRINFVNGNFANSSVSIVPFGVSGNFHCEDFNQDGLVDLFYFNTEKNIIGIGEGNLQFDFIEHSKKIGGFSYLTDYDFDGDIDILLTSKNTNRVALIKNYFGSNYSLSGTIFYDENLNELKDSIEQALPIVDLNVSPTNAANYLTYTGDYNVNLDTGYHTISFNQNPLWNLTTDSISYSKFLDNINPSYDSLMFGFYPDTLIEQLQGDLVSNPNARCNDTINFWINIVNSGTLPVNSVVELELDATMVFVSSDSLPNSSGSNWSKWNLDSIGILNNLNIPFRAQIPPANFGAGDTLISTLKIYEIDSLGDSTLMIVDTLSQIIVCSYDPNTKSVLPEGEGITGNIDPVLVDELEYQIDFQNLGNDTAFDVVIIDQLDPNLDWTSFELISSSYPTSASINNLGELKFNFIGINLTDTITSEPLSHGFVKYRIDIDSNLSVNTQINNQAEIFFDLNTAIQTNVTTNTLVNCDFSLFIDTTIQYCWYDTIATVPVSVNDQYSITWSINSVVFDNIPDFSWQPDSLGPFLIEADISSQYCSDTHFSFPINVEQTLTDSSIIDNFCFGDTVYFLNDTITANFATTDTVITQGCNGIIYDYQANMFTTQDSIVTIDLCYGDSVDVNGMIIYSDTTIIDTIFNSMCGTQVIHNVNTLYIDISAPVYQITSGILSATFAQADTYQWIDCTTGQLIPGETSSTYSPTINGSYAVLMEFLGCSDTSDCFMVSDLSINPNELSDQQQINLYPNPTSGRVLIQVPSQHSFLRVQVINLLGEVLTSRDIHESEFELFISEAPGTYLLRFRSKEGTAVIKRIIKN